MGAHWRRTFAAVGGFKEEAEWKPTLNDLTPSPYSITPDGLPSPTASDHKNDPSRPHEPHPWAQDQKIVGYPTGAELVKRLEVVEREQERKKRHRHKQTGAGSGSHDMMSDYDLDCILSDGSSEWSQSGSGNKTPAVLDSKLTQDERSLVESLIVESESHPSPGWFDTLREEDMGPSDHYSNLEREGSQDSRDSATPAIPGSPVSEPTQAQRAALESLRDSSPLPSPDTSSNRSTQESTKTLKRDVDSSPLIQLKKRMTSASDGLKSSTAPLGEAACGTASPTALEASASNPVGALARNAGMEVRRRSKKASKSKRKQTAKFGAGVSQISTGHDSIEQMHCEPANEVMATPNGKAKTALPSPLVDMTPTATNGDDSIEVVGHGSKDVLPELSRDQSKEKGERKTDSSFQGPLYRETMNHRRSPQVSRPGREKQKQTVQVVIYQPYAQPGSSKAQSSTMNNPKKTQKSQKPNSPARSTRSKTDPDTPFVQLNQKGKQSYIDQALEDKKAEEEAERQRKVERRYWRWHKKQKREKKNMRRVWKEWFDEQDDEFERRQAARGKWFPIFGFMVATWGVRVEVGG
ncbi:hypothetical protein G7Y79_00046g082440 [Physcia stellaris]|nr:hypothetical protein G7Y79_00046g082440 [Physcia stellaris]